MKKNLEVVFAEYVEALMVAAEQDGVTDMFDSAIKDLVDAKEEAQKKLDFLNEAEAVFQSLPIEILTRLLARRLKNEINHTGDAKVATQVHETIDSIFNDL